MLPNRPSELEKGIDKNHGQYADLEFPERQWRALRKGDFIEQLIDLIVHAKQCNRAGEYQQGGRGKEGFFAHQAIDHLAVDDTVIAFEYGVCPLLAHTIHGSEQAALSLKIAAFGIGDVRDPARYEHG